MRLPHPVTSALFSHLLTIAVRRPPDVIIGGHDAPYLRRWHLIPRNPVFNIYLHAFARSDDDRALHDHPWHNLSLLLCGSYVEHTPTARHRRAKGALVLRGPRAAHRIALDAGPCWTLFITGPRLRAWGFHCPQGWRHWQDFTNAADGGSTIGKGCE